MIRLDLAWDKGDETRVFRWKKVEREREKER